MASAIMLRGTASRVIGGGGNQFYGRSFSTAVNHIRLILPNSNYFRGRSISIAVNQARLIIPSTKLSFVQKFSSQSAVKVSEEDVKKVSFDESIENLYSKLESIRLELESIRRVESVKGKDQSAENEELAEAVVGTDQGQTDNQSDYDNSLYSDTDDHSKSESDVESEGVASEGEAEAIKGEPEGQDVTPSYVNNDQKYSSFIKGIESEIVQAVNFSHAADEETKIPEGFPFKVEEDRPGTPSIVLSREYEGERIEVTVQNPTVFTHNYYDDSDCTKEYKVIKDASFHMDLSVRVTCRNSNKTKVEFKGTAFKDRFCMYRARDPADGIDNEGVHLSELDKDLQSEFHKYLEIRGIKPSTTNHIYQYMLGKANREKLRLLQKFKNLV